MNNEYTSPFSERYAGAEMNVIAAIILVQLPQKTSAAA